MFLDPTYWTEFYDDDESFDWYSAAGAVYAAAMREVAVRPSATVLDVGCGTAAHLAALVPFANVTGVDFAASVVQAASTLAPAVDFACADARHLPFRAGSFDVIVDKGCLDCFVGGGAADRAAYLRELRRVLRPRGALVLCSVSGVDVVTLLRDGVALRHDDQRVGVKRPPNSDWERERSDYSSEFVVTQIVASHNKHIFRCLPRDGDDVSDKKSIRRSSEEPPDFEDLTADELTLEDGFYCGRCATQVASTLATDDAAGFFVAADCPGCAAPLRRFALS